MRYGFRRCLVLFLTLLTLGCPSLGGAGALVSGGKSALSSEQDGIVQRVHGFHCRPELGWDPRSGLFRRHSHAGICSNYKRCLEVHHRCIFVLGRGWDSWKYERWYDDNWRYTNCMLERGCY